MSADAGIDPIFISAQQAADALNVTRWQLYKLLDEQHIDSRYLGRRRLVSVSSLRAYAEGLSIYPTPSAS
jgi:excisionase family DNA binding protein